MRWNERLRRGCLWGLWVVWAILAAGCDESKLVSPKYRRPAAGAYWQRYKPAELAELKPDMLTRGVVVLRYLRYVAVYDPLTDKARACTVPDGVVFAVRRPHVWWVQFVPGRIPRSGRGPAFRRGFYLDLRTGRRQEIREFDARAVRTPLTLPDETSRPPGVFRDDWFVTWDPARKQYRRLHGPSGRWAVLPDGEKLPPGWAVAGFEMKDGRVDRVVLTPRFHCIGPGAPPCEAFAHDPAKQTWRRVYAPPAKPIKGVYGPWLWRPRGVRTVDGRHYEWLNAPYGPIRTAEGLDAAKALRSGKARRIPVVKGYPPGRLLPEEFRPLQPSPERWKAARALLPKAFSDAHVPLAIAYAESKVWVIWREASAQGCGNEPFAPMAYPPAASTLVDLQTGQVQTDPPGDRKPLGYPIVPIGMWKGYRFAAEYIPAQRPDGSKVISFVVIRHPRSGKWVRVESLRGEGFGIRGDYAYALLPADELMPWLHRAEAATLVRAAFSGR